MSALDWVVLCVGIGVPSVLALLLSAGLDQMRRERNTWRGLSEAYEKQCNGWRASNTKLLESYTELTWRHIELRNSVASPPAPAGETSSEPNRDSDPE